MLLEEAKEDARFRKEMPESMKKSPPTFAKGIKDVSKATWRWVQDFLALLKCFHKDLIIEVIHNTMQLTKITCSTRVQVNQEYFNIQAWFIRRTSHVPNLVQELSTAKVQRLNQIKFGKRIKYGKRIKFDNSCRIMRLWYGN